MASLAFFAIIRRAYSRPKRSKKKNTVIESIETTTTKESSSSKKEKKQSKKKQRNQFRSKSLARLDSTRNKWKKRQEECKKQAITRDLRASKTRKSRRFLKVSSTKEPRWTEIFADSRLFILFREYAHERHTAESVSFLVSVGIYRLMDGSRARRKFAEKIHQTFIDKNTARDPINISYSIRKSIVRDLSKSPRSLYDEASEEITRILRYDVFPGFISSNGYKKKRNHLPVELSTPRETVKLFELLQEKRQKRQRSRKQLRRAFSQ
mmetsp:Transcript_14668/g.16278  ORF Transcript_14668/g.16278 Transcript_14668/m.16278 type:complete len:266 (+) Transcript_14668:96-893(+)